MAIHFPTVNIILISPIRSQTHKKDNSYCYVQELYDYIHLNFDKLSMIKYD